ncbi:MAG TPA: STN domain-containing protein [Bradyrhizobium sp.]|nr:STN domain-containing protein [Bradyrhizobium sp.]
MQYSKAQLYGGRPFDLVVAKTVGYLLAFVIVISACFYAAAAAQQNVAPPPSELDFDIPSQPLDAALQTYGNQAGVQVLYESQLAVDRRSTTVRGRFSAATALNLLLSGTGLIVREVRPSSITIALPSRRLDSVLRQNLQEPADLSIGELRVRAPGRSIDTSGLRDYNAAVQLDIQKALKKNPGTRSGSYRAVLDLWINPSQTIQRTALLQSTGDANRDAAIAAALQGVTINRQPPPHTPQPIRIAVDVTEVK